ncbi:hypothetical protein C8Q80DRAFT_1195970 [Daedaleopsis nitida]|nr:hypothetical protein C8Q80DRAFT_1195970 [Daedaleopsis nitida]
MFASREEVCRLAARIFGGPQPEPELLRARCLGRRLANHSRAAGARPCRASPSPPTASPSAVVFARGRGGCPLLGRRPDVCASMSQYSPSLPLPQAQGILFACGRDASTFLQMSPSPGVCARRDDSKAATFTHTPLPPEPGALRLEEHVLDAQARVRHVALAEQVPGTCPRLARGGRSYGPTTAFATAARRSRKSAFHCAQPTEPIPSQKPRAPQGPFPFGRRRQISSASRSSRRAPSTEHRTPSLARASQTGHVGESA